jgi:hypothetical protein
VDAGHERDPELQAGLGVFIADESGEQLNVRTFPSHVTPLNVEGLRAWLNSQDWGVQPREVVVEQTDRLIIVAGTFVTKRMGIVRQWRD